MKATKTQKVLNFERYC